MILLLNDIKCVNNRIIIIIIITINQSRGIDHTTIAGKVNVIFTLRAKLSGAVYCNRSCLWVCLFVALLPR